MASSPATRYDSPTLIASLRPDRPWRTLWQHRQLIRQLTRREIALRYRGSVLGLLWSFIVPLAMLTIYTVVFGVILGPKHATEATDDLQKNLEFAMHLFCGMVVFSLFAETVGQAPAVLTGSVSYVKRIVFPLEILVVIKLGAALVHTLISFVILLLGLAVIFGGLQPTLLLMPLVLLPLILLTLGLAWFLASVGVYVRDMTHAIGVIVQMLFFATPIFYPITAVPEVLHPLMYTNPLTTVVENARQVCIHGDWPQWHLLLVVTLVGLAVAQLGYAWFVKTKRGFADVL